MHTFVCTKCNHVDAVIFAYPDGLQDKPPEEWVCTQCKTGEWHNFFDYAMYRPGFDIVINGDDGLGLEETF